MGALIRGKFVMNISEVGVMMRVEVTLMVIDGEG
jgi:hypothetical protein